MFLDIKKAFDSVPHNTLLNKLYHLKTPSIILRWMIGYLSNRFQQVVFKGCSSTWLPVRLGVPQGSILIFLLYMNDISDVPLSPGTKRLLFADDILLFKPIKSDSDFCDFQKDIDAISNWTVANHLTLNANKTKFMLIFSPHTITLSVIFTQWHPDRKGETFQISRHLAIGRPHMVQTH